MYTCVFAYIYIYIYVYIYISHMYVYKNKKKCAYISVCILTTILHINTYISCLYSGKPVNILLCFWKGGVGWGAVQWGGVGWWGG